MNREVDILKIGLPRQVLESSRSPTGALLSHSNYAGNTWLSQMTKAPKSEWKIESSFIYASGINF
ncbi:hypothetical protein GALMADRAFT_919136 [Galerina marginata CBS 339.88]|uniref:Uncharacterized protein n=1 Tax=Galerina marginata (strain CBS 339.88) TaxID=685588 RepID=A0A067SNV9_GALM3|nr:hypothetical protein GALMADRAFT_919136 [Galerina marginata CBS 339.88]